MHAKYTSDNSAVSEYEPNLALQNLPHLFTDEELSYLARWSMRAQALQSGNATAESEKEKVFVDVCKGLRPPETKFHRLWLRYNQALAAEQALAEKAQFALVIESLQSEISRLKAAHSGVWKHHEKVTREFEKKLQQSESREVELRKLIREYRQKLGIPEESPKPVSDPYPSAHEWREQK